MGKLITVVGNSGVGKTTLTHALCRATSLVGGLEQHEARPFQQLFAQDLHRYGLANQIDYLLFRAEQELAIRRGPSPGIQDGGLDEDFQLFTRHFHQKGYLTDAEFALCRRCYQFYREWLPPPDLIIHMTAPLELIAERYGRRGRRLEIAQRRDLAALERLLESWLASVSTVPILTVDAGVEDPDYTAALDWLVPRLAALIGVNLA